MKRNEWIRYYRNMVFPVLAVTALLGILMTVFLLRNAHQSSRDECMHALQLADDNVSEMMGDMDYYMYSLWPNTQIMIILKRLLSSETYPYTDSRDQELIRTFVSTPVYTKLYLHSAYIYYVHYDKLILSEQGLIPVSDFYDREWLNMVNDENDEVPDVMRRSLRQYAFEKTETEVVSVSRKYYTSKNHKNYGIVTLNFMVEKVNERLKSFVNGEGQSIYVGYETGEILFEAEKIPGVDEQLLQSIMASGKEEMTILADGRKYIVYQMKNEHSGFTYLFMAPISEEMKLAFPLVFMIFGVMIVTAVLGIILSWIMTRRRYTLQNQVASIIEYYEKSGEYPEKLRQIGEEYDYFFQSVLKIFEEHRRAIILDYEKQIQLERAEIKTLQMQINPHFLYNTMETIYWKVMEAAKGYCPANQMIENLSDILHYSLSEGDDLVKLQDELETAEKYIQIQKMRFGDFFEVIYDKDERCMDAEVPKLFLQPLIENGIQHGLLAGCEMERPGKMKIKVRDQGKEVVISVIDNGVGVPESRLRELQRQLKEGKAGEGHIGLFNTNLRIRLHFGEQYGIKLYGRPGMGCVVKIRLPKRRHMVSGKGEENVSGR